MANTEMDLWTASLEGCQEEVLRILTSHHDGSIDKPKANPNLLNENGFAPIHYAAMLGHDAIVILLLQYGAMIDIQDLVSLDTPLHKAARGGHVGIAKLLVAEGCDNTLANAEGKTPLDVAVGRFDSEMTSVLSQSPPSNRSKMAKAVSSSHVGLGRRKPLKREAASHYQTFCEIPLSTMKQICATGDNYREQASQLTNKAQKLEKDSRVKTEEMVRCRAALAKTEDENKALRRQIQLLESDKKNSKVNMDALLSENIELRRAKKKLDALEMDHHHLNGTRRREQEESRDTIEHWKDKVSKLRDRESVLERKIMALEVSLNEAQIKIDAFNSSSAQVGKVVQREMRKEMINMAHQPNLPKRTAEDNSNMLTKNDFHNEDVRDISARLKRTEEQFEELKSTLKEFLPPPTNLHHSHCPQHATKYIPQTPLPRDRGFTEPFHLHHRRQSIPYSNGGVVVCAGCAGCRDTSWSNSNG